MELSLHLVQAIALAVCLCIIIILVARTQATNLPDVPWVYRDQKQWFSKTRARLRATVAYRDALHHAYNQYSRSGQTCILPSIFRDIILLPPIHVNWIAGQPDSTVNFIDVARDQLQLDHTLLRPQISYYPSHHDTIRMDLTRRLGSLTEDLLDELDYAFGQLWGTDESWREVCVFDTMMKIVAETSNRVFVGKRLCRDERYLSATLGFAKSIAVVSSLLRKFPSLLRAVLGPIVAQPTHRQERAYTNLLKPLVISRLQNKFSEESKKPVDFLQWTVDRALASDHDSERDPGIIAARILVVNFAAIHTSTFSITNAVFDLIASDPANITALRNEAEQALASTGGQWSKATVQKLIKHDSSLRESSRLGIFSNTTLTRMVTARGGLDTPDGIHCPQGSWIGIPGNAIHFDPTLYQDVEQYRPFRFSDMKTSVNPVDDNKKESMIEKARLSFVTTSSTFQTFGHGRHACPGRFFAANELKLLLAYMVLNYDFVKLDERPASKWYGEIQVPPMRATIKVRRRKTSVT